MRIILVFLFSLVSVSFGIAQCGNGKTLHLGSKGGCYYYTPSGNKKYVERYCCDHLIKDSGKRVPLVAPGKSDSDNPCGYYNGHLLYKGPKGGCYYFNKNGNKSYVDKYLCKC